jgi:transcriptional regulator of acetoin/glycerol metabolism
VPTGGAKIQCFRWQRAEALPFVANILNVARLPPERLKKAPHIFVGFCSLKSFIEKTEKEAILRALSSTRGDVTDAAKILDIHRTTLYKKIERYRISSHC